MKKLLLSLITVPVVVVNTSSTQVKSSVETEVEGGQAKVETNITTEVNGHRTEVNVNQPGKIEVKVQNDSVEIKKDPNVFPTIITTGSPTITENQEPMEGEKNVINKDKALSNLKNNIDGKIYNFLKRFWSNVISLFQKKS